MYLHFINFSVSERDKRQGGGDTHANIQKWLERFKRRCESLKVMIKYAGTFYSIPRYEVVLEGDETLIGNVMEKLMKTRAGG